MISKQEYLAAKKIVDQYTEEQLILSQKKSDYCKWGRFKESCSLSLHIKPVGCMDCPHLI